VVQQQLLLLLLAEAQLFARLLQLQQLWRQTGAASHVPRLSLSLLLLPA
jgi:hypothetical protein